MKAIIKTIDAEKFSLNGLVYPKSFIPFKTKNNLVRIISKFDSRLVIEGDLSIDEIQVDGNIYNNINSLLAGLLSVIYKRNSNSNSKSLIMSNPVEGASYNTNQNITINTTVS